MVRIAREVQLPSCRGEDPPSADASRHAVSRETPDRYVGPSEGSVASIDAMAQRVELLAGRCGNTASFQIAELFLHVRGAALTQLKNRLDVGRHGLLPIVYDRLSEAARGVVLRHIAASAEPAGALKVITDMDDTFYANWADRRFPGKTVYPGVRQFYLELAGHEVLTVLTARPADPSNMAVCAVRRRMAAHGIHQVAVLTGEVTHWVGNHRPARKKLENLRRYLSLFPEYRMVLVGDSGQGDVFVAETMRREAPHRVPAAFIHDVSGLCAAEKARLRRVGVAVGDTYVDLACSALAMGLGAMSPERVLAAAKAEMADIVFDSPFRAQARHDELSLAERRVLALAA